METVFDFEGCFLSNRVEKMGREDRLGRCGVFSSESSIERSSLDGVVDFVGIEIDDGSCLTRIIEDHEQNANTRL